MCGKKYSIEDRHAGRGVKCPACGAGMTVGGLPNHDDEPPDVPPPAQRPAQPTDSQVLRRMCNSLERIEGSVFWIHLILAVPFCLGLLGVLLWAFNAINATAYQSRP